MTRIKICGLTSREDIQAVNMTRPDFAGFIVDYPKSRRSISVERLRTLVQELDKKILPVGVFVNAPPELPAALLEEGCIALAQLHGQEDETYLQSMRQYTDKPVIKAFSVKSREVIRQAALSKADYILLDQGGGGTGQTFDWSLVPEMTRPFFLAGGLSVENLEEAVRRLSPWAVDLSSSVETGGKKDPEKIRAAVEKIRQIDI